MHYALSEEQAELASMVRALLDKRADSLAVRAAAESDTGYDATLWSTLTEQVGVAALHVPEEYDGAGFGFFETAVVLEELGRSLAPTPLLASVVTAAVVQALGDPETCARLLPALAMGTVGTIAWSGPSGLAGAEEPVLCDGDVLTGTVANVLDGDNAELLLVAARDASGEVAVFEVDPAAVTRTWTPAMDGTLRLATVTFDGTPGVRLPGDAAAALAHGHVVGAAATIALAIGCLQRGLDMTVAYSKERVQFGRAIGSFQALKHRMADMLVQLETSRSTSWAASYAVATGAGNAGDLVHYAKSYVGEALDLIASETVQLHGGIAITWEHDAQMVFKRAHALGQLFGQAHQHRSLVSLDA